MTKRKDDFHYQEWPGQKPKRAFNMNRYLENSEKREAAAKRKSTVTKKTVMSGGEHIPIDDNKSNGKREKIVTGKGGTVQYRIKEETTSAIKQNMSSGKYNDEDAAVAEYKRVNRKALDSSRGYSVDNQRYSHSYKDGKHFLHVKTHDGKHGSKFHVTKSSTGYPILNLVGYSTSLGESKALSVTQRLQRGRQIKRSMPKLARGARRYSMMSPSSGRLWKRSERAARTLLKKRYSPIKGRSYGSLSVSQKIMVDKILEKKQVLIKKLARRLLPKVRQASIARLKSARNRTNEAFNELFPTTQNQLIENKINDLGTMHPFSASLKTINALATGDDKAPAVIALKEKAVKAGVEFSEILNVYNEALDAYDPDKTKLNSEQFAFNAINSFVAKQINEGFGLFSAAFIPPTTRFMHAIGSGSRLGIGHGGGGAGTNRYDHYGFGDKARTAAKESYAREHHTNRVIAAVGEKGVGKYKFSRKGKFSSDDSYVHAETVDKHYHGAKAAAPNEMKAFPNKAIDSYAKTNKLSKDVSDGMKSYHNHLAVATKDNFKKESIDESLKLKGHDGKREVDPKTVHEIHWNGKHSGHQLHRSSTGITSGGDRYTLKTAAGTTLTHSHGPLKGKPVNMTLGVWQDVLAKEFRKHDKLNNIKEEHEFDTMVAHVLDAIKTIGPTKHPIDGPKHIAGVAKEYAKERTKNALNKIRARVKAARAEKDD